MKSPRLKPGMSQAAYMADAFNKFGKAALELVSTKSEMQIAVEAVATRGTLQEIGFAGVAVRVPFWRVAAVRDFLRAFVPITVALDVRPLSVKDHFRRWRVEWLDPVKTELKKPIRVDTWAQRHGRREFDDFRARLAHYNDTEHQ